MATFIDNFLASRTTDAYARTKSGLYAYSPPNVPARSDKGMAVFDSFTNRIRNPRFTGGVSGTPGTLPTTFSEFSNAGYNFTRSLIFQVDSDGVPIMGVRYAGTPTTVSGFGAISIGQGFNTTAVSGNTVIVDTEVWVEAAVGPLPTTLWLAIQGYASDGTTLTESQNTNITNARYKRTTSVKVLSNGSTAYVLPQLRFIPTVNVAHDFTIWFKAPVMTTDRTFTLNSAILPAVGDVNISSKNADNITSLMGSGSAPFPGWTEGGLGSGFSFAGSSYYDNINMGVERTLFEISDGTNSNSIRLFLGTDQKLNLAVRRGGSQVAIATTTTGVPSVGRHIWSGNISNAGLILVQNNGLVEAKTAAAFTMPSSLNVLRVGSGVDGKYLNDTIEQIYFGVNTPDIAPLQNWVVRN